MKDLAGPLVERLVDPALLLGRLLLAWLFLHEGFVLAINLDGALAAMAKLGVSAPLCSPPSRCSLQRALRSPRAGRRASPRSRSACSALPPRRSSIPIWQTATSCCTSKRISPSPAACWRWPPAVPARGHSTGCRRAFTRGVALRRRPVGLAGAAQGTGARHQGPDGFCSRHPGLPSVDDDAEHQRAGGGNWPQTQPTLPAPFNGLLPPPCPGPRRACGGAAPPLPRRPETGTPAAAPARRWPAGCRPSSPWRNSSGSRRPGRS